MIRAPVGLALLLLVLTPAAAFADDTTWSEAETPEDRGSALDLRLHRKADLVLDMSVGGDAVWKVGFPMTGVILGLVVADIALNQNLIYSGLIYPTSPWGLSWAIFANSGWKGRGVLIADGQLADRGLHRAAERYGHYMIVGTQWRVYGFLYSAGMAAVGGLIYLASSASGNGYEFYAAPWFGTSVAFLISAGVAQGATDVRRNQTSHFDMFGSSPPWVDVRNQVGGLRLSGRF